MDVVHHAATEQFEGKAERDQLRVVEVIDVGRQPQAPGQETPYRRRHPAQAAAAERRHAHDAHAGDAFTALSRSDHGHGKAVGRESGIPYERCDRRRLVRRGDVHNAGRELTQRGEHARLAGAA